MPKPPQSILPYRGKESILEAHMEHILICCTYWWSKTVQTQKEFLLFEGPTVTGWRHALGKIHFEEFLFLGKHNGDEILIENWECIMCFIFIY